MVGLNAIQCIFKYSYVYENQVMTRDSDVTLYVELNMSLIHV